MLLSNFYSKYVGPVNSFRELSLFPGFGYVNLSRFTPIAVFNPGNNSFVLLTLPKGLLTPGSKYRFKLTVDDGSEVGVASLDVEVRTGPTSGSLSVEPMSVKALDTVTLSGEHRKYLTCF